MANVIDLLVPLVGGTCNDPLGRCRPKLEALDCQVPACLLSLGIQWMEKMETAGGGHTGYMVVSQNACPPNNRAKSFVALILGTLSKNS